MCKEERKERREEWGEKRDERRRAISKKRSNVLAGGRESVAVLEGKRFEIEKLERAEEKEEGEGERTAGNKRVRKIGMTENAMKGGEERGR